MTSYKGKNQKKEDLNRNSKIILPSIEYFIGYLIE